MESQRPVRVVRFGTFEFCPQTGELRKAGVRIKVQQQPLKVLEILLQRPGDIVTREELREQISPTDTFGDFDQAVNVAIAKLRAALGDSAQNPRYIETLPRFGYRFLAVVTDADGSKSLKEPDVAQPRAPRPSRSRAWMPAGIALTILIAGAIVWVVYRYSEPQQTIKSLAVLPLESLSGDASQDYFADGMTDELITDLAQISALRVISRTSVMAYKKARRPLAEIARELNVDAVVEGTVLRSGERVRITAQLIQVRDEKHLWAQRYEGDIRNALSLQSEVTHSIAEQIKINLKPRELAALQAKPVVDPEAYEDYLKGRYFWNKRTANGLRTAVAYFEQAIDRDKDYARAYSGLADSYALMGDWEYGVLPSSQAYPKAKAAATKALALDNSLSEAHTSLAFCLDAFDWDWNSAEREFKRAIELNPGYATAHHWYAWHLMVLGRTDEGLVEMQKALSLDPLSLIVSSDLADALLVARKYDQSIQQSRGAISMDPTFAVAHYELGQAYLQKMMFNEAIEELTKAAELSGTGTTFKSNLAYAYAMAGRREEAVKILNDFERDSGSGPFNNTEIALIYTGLGDKDKAMYRLEKAYEQRFNPSILVRPAFDPLRTDKRFETLVHRIGLP
jgi:TolB-like protein/DNA-binding winged helix-turn-helix (wHTH) protein